MKKLNSKGIKKLSIQEAIIYVKSYPNQAEEVKSHVKELIEDGHYSYCFKERLNIEKELACLGLDKMMGDKIDQSLESLDFKSDIEGILELIVNEGLSDQRARMAVENIPKALSGCHFDNLKNVKKYISNIRTTCLFSERFKELLTEENPWFPDVIFVIKHTKDKALYPLLKKCVDNEMQKEKDIVFACRMIEKLDDTCYISGALNNLDKILSEFAFLSLSKEYLELKSDSEFIKLPSSDYCFSRIKVYLKCMAVSLGPDFRRGFSYKFRSDKVILEIIEEAEVKVNLSKLIK